MAALLTIFHAAAIFFGARYFWKKETGLKVFFWPALLVKLLAGVALGLVYTWYYSTADTFAYFHDASQLAGLALIDFPSYVGVLFQGNLPESAHLILDEPRALFLSKITSVFNIITGNNYWVIGAYFSALCFSGVWYLVKAIVRHLPAAATPAIVAFLFLPSVVFWSAGLLKESLAVGALYYLSALFIKIWFRERVRLWHLFTAAVSFWLLWNLKYYFAAVFIPIICATLLYKTALSLRVIKSGLVKVLIWVAFLILPVIGIMFLHPNFYPHRLFDVVLANNAAYIALSDPQGVVHFHNLQPTAVSFAENAPWALFSGLFRPLVWETSALLPFAAGVENTLVLLFFAAAVFQFRKHLPLLQAPLVFAGAAYIIVLSVLLTYSAPNFGTLSRYRCGYFSFFVFIILCGNPLLGFMQRSIRRLVSH